MAICVQKSELQDGVEIRGHEVRRHRTGTGSSLIKRTQSLVPRSSISP